MSIDHSPDAANRIPDCPEYPLHCVFLSCFRSNIEFLQHLLSFSGIRIHRADTLEQADFLLTVTGSTVLISDTIFLDGAWQDALDMLLSLHTRVSFVVAADPVDSGFIADAIDCGACAIVSKPLDFSEIMRTIRTLHEAVLERLSWSAEATRESPCRP